MTTVSLDFETRSAVDIQKRGAYRYAEDKSTGIWCLAYAFDDEPVQIATEAELMRQEPARLLLAVAEGKAHFRAFNANFERNIWRSIMHERMGWPDIALERWHCTMVDCCAMALPHSLERAAKALGLAQKKDMAGHRLMVQLSRPTNYKALAKGTESTPVFEATPDQLARLYSYCKQDVVVERAVHMRVPAIPAVERQVWLEDQRINDRGIQMDTTLARRIYGRYVTSVDAAGQELARITGGAVTKVNGHKQFREWLATQGYELDSIAKAALQDLLRTAGTPDIVRKAIEVRLSGAKTSLAKALSILKYASPRDHRGRGLLQYHGADTGRWAGRGLQPQNLPAHTRRLPAGFAQEWLASARKLFREGHSDAVEMLWDANEAAALLIRTCLTAGPGKKLVWADYSQVEARVVAWLAGEQWLLDAFRQGDKEGRSVVYEAMASKIYNVPARTIGKHSEERQMGKRVVLGAGFGMGARRFRDTCAQDGVALSEGAAKTIIDIYRNTNRNISQYWQKVDRWMVQAVRKPGVPVSMTRGMACLVRDGYLRIILPSHQRALAYAAPELASRMTPWGSQQDCVTAMRCTGPNKAWLRIDLCGTFVTENLTQAVARDLLALSLLRIARTLPSVSVVFHVHDEVVAEAPSDASPGMLRDCMMVAPEWAAGLPIAAEADQGPWYRK